MREENSGAKRFISAYNRIDQALRTIYSVKRSMTFTDMIRKVAGVNTIVSKFEEDLIDFSRLRNAIVHRSGEEIIAEPNTSVVEQIEKISRLISTPPKVIDCIKKRSVFSVDSSVSLREIITSMGRLGYSVVPVYTSGTLMGVINRKMIIDGISEIIKSGNDLEEAFDQPIENVLDVFSQTNHYEIVSKNITVENLMYIFTQNRKLTSVILTENGNYNEKPIAVVVSSDIIDLNKILDNY